MENLEMNQKDNFEDTYKDLNRTLSEINDQGKYASWLIIGVVIGRVYQYIRSIKKRIGTRRNK
jgi:hypothetical protein